MRRSARLRLVAAAMPVLASGVMMLLHPAPARAEWVLAGYAGAAHTSDASLTISQAAADTDITFTPVRFRGESLTPPLYYGARLTFFRRSSWLGLETEFIHLKAYADSAGSARATGRYRGTALDEELPLDDIVQRFSISHGLNFLIVNAVARRAIGATSKPDGVVVLARLGLGPTIPHGESTVDRVSHEGYAWGALGLHAAGGVQVTVRGGAAVIAEYKFTRTRQTVDVDRGEARALFQSHHAIVGLAWRF